jgi:hypothetical protein
MRRLTLILTLALAFVACGGDDKLSTEDYRAEVKKICSDAQRQTKAVEQPTRATSAAIADYLQRLRDINAKTIGKIDELEPPDELADEHDRAVQVSREGRRQIDAVIEELKGGGDPAQVLTEAREELQGSSAESKAAGRALGVRECAE